MKKILLSIFSIFLFSFYSNAQTVLNEIYGLPGTGYHEFIELYNNRADNSNVNVDCWTVAFYFNDGVEEGFYIIDLPDKEVVYKGYFVAASADPYFVQGEDLLGPGKTPNFDWSDIAGHPADFAKIWKYKLNGTKTAWIDDSGNIADINDIISKSTEPSISHKYAVIVFVDGVFRNGFIGGDNSSFLDSDIGAYPNLVFPSVSNVANTCMPNYTMDFTQLVNRPFENVISASGSNNGYYRMNDGACGTWAKSSSQDDHTPGATNGTADAGAGILDVTEVMGCNQGTNPSTSKFTTTVVNSDAFNFPVEVSVFYDDGTTSGTFDAGDSPVGIQVVNASGGMVVFDNLTPNYATIFVRYRTNFGCTDQVNIHQECNPLPITLNYFNASRNDDNVNLIWETSTEQNNSGFEIQRRIGNGGFETISFVESKAPDGNSDSRLTYTHKDLNTTDGITQYRLRQVDFDNRSTYSDIRSVRGESQKAKTIIYPNPSSNGIVNVVFEETNILRDVSLMDMSGRIVRQWNNMRSNNLQIADLTRGIYSLRIVDRDAGTQTIEKFIVR